MGSRMWEQRSNQRVEPADASLQKTIFEEVLTFVTRGN